ncbi:MAG: PD-(D/E)XK nuclease family protein [Candidatus Coprovivens sp.]
MSLVGRIDLLVLDNKGVPHIVDYKTSPKSYD